MENNNIEDLLITLSCESLKVYNNKIINGSKNTILIESNLQFLVLNGDYNTINVSHTNKNILFRLKIIALAK